MVESIRPAVVEDWPQASVVLAAAFADDPVFGWLVPDPEHRRRALGRHFPVESRCVALPHGSCLLAEDGGALGAALVLPPDRWRVPFRVQARHGLSYLRGFGTRLPRALALQTALERKHLTEPHHYIAYVGVTTSAQGRGLGTRLLTPVLERCVQDGVPAYLEASNPDCRRLYERLGFRAIEEVRPLGAPPLWLMSVRP